MNYKILCSDLDGTLLSTVNDVSDFTKSEITRIKQNIKIILVSARMPKAMAYLQKRLGIVDEPMVCYNGALVLDGSIQIFSTEVHISMIESIREITKLNKIKLGLYHNDEWYTAEDSDIIQKEIECTRVTPIFKQTKETIYNWKIRNIGAHKLMLMGEKEALDTMEPILGKKFDSNLLWYRSNENILEIAPIGTSKLLGIKKLLRNNQTLNDVIAFGDNFNDIEMLQEVGCGVAVDNAKHEVKSVADKIILKNTDDGVAHFIKKHFVIQSLS